MSKRLAIILVAGLCYAQPLVRSWRRYRTRLFSYSPLQADPAAPEGRARRLPLTGNLTAGYWGEAGYERAFPAIVDTHVTTFLSGLILFQFGSGPVKFVSPAPTNVASDTVSSDWLRV